MVLCKEIENVYSNLKSEIEEHKMYENLNKYGSQIAQCVGHQNYKCRKIRRNYYRNLEGIRGWEGIDALYQNQCQNKKDVKISCNDLFFTQKTWDDEIDRFNFFITIGGKKDKYAEIMRNNYSILQEFCPLK